RVLSRAPALEHIADFAPAPDEAFGEHEACREIEIVTGRSHGDGKGLARNADLERLFGHDPIDGRSTAARGDTYDPTQRAGRVVVGAAGCHDGRSPVGPLSLAPLLA